MPVKWTPEQKAKACEEILAKVSQGQSLIGACRNGDDWTPAEATFRLWCDQDPELAARYTRARDDRADKIFEECLAIADSQEGDVVLVDGVEQVNHDAIQRARLRIDTRKWMLGKMQPKVYGDKLDLNHKGGFAVTIVRDDADL